MISIYEQVESATVLLNVSTLGEPQGNCQGGGTTEADVMLIKRNPAV